MKKESDKVLIEALLKEDAESMISKKSLVGHLKGIGVKDSVVERVGGCCNKLIFATDDGLTSKKEVFAITCQNRFCPMCQKRDSYNKFYNLLTASSFLTRNKDYDVFFITLTVVNVTGELLKDCVDSINKSVNYLMKLAPFRSINNYSIKLEVTHNELRDTYHPHIHGLFFVDKKKSVKLGKKKVLELWNEVYKKYCPFYKKVTQVDVQKVKKDNFEGSLLEVSKYAVKSSDFVKSLSVFEVFYYALYKKQLFRANGDLGALFRAIDSLKKEHEFKTFFDSFLGKEVDETYYNRLFESRFSFKKEVYSTTELDESSPYYKSLEDLNKKVVVELDEVITFLTDKIETLRREVSSLIAKEFNYFDADNNRVCYDKPKRKREKRAADYTVLLDCLVSLRDQKTKKREKKKVNS